MIITDVKTIPIRSMGKPAPRGKGRVIITPMNAFYDQPAWGSREAPIAFLLVEVATDDGITGIGSVGGAYGHAHYTIEHHLKHILTVRSAIGPDIDLAADAFMGWDVNYAVRMIRLLEDAGMNLAWIEEPVMPDDLPGYARIAAEVQTPISGGEHEYTRYGFRDLIERRAVDIVQLDVSRAGGITEARRIWALAAAHDLPVYPHGGRVYNYHLIMAHLNSPLAEYFPPQLGNPYVNDYLWTLWNGEPRAQDGHITLSDKPGLGIEINREAVETYRAEMP